MKSLVDAPRADAVTRRPEDLERSHTASPAQCAGHYHRRTKTRRRTAYKFWWCETATRGQGNPCHAPQIRENRLQELLTHALGLSEWDEESVIEAGTAISINPDGTLTITSRNQDGTTWPINPNTSHHKKAETHA